MTDYVLEAEVRENTGKAHTRRLRRAGKLPGIIYGGDKPDLPIILDYNETSKIMMRDEAFYTSMIEVKVKGKRGKNTVLLKDTQWDAIYDTPTHLDFFRVSGSDIVDMEVPIHMLGEDDAPGVKQGGMIDVIRRHLDIQCRADSIPEYIVVDCSALEIGDAIHILDVTIPEGVTIPALEAELDEDGEPINFTMVICAAPKVEEESEEGADAPVTESEHGGEAADTPATEEKKED